MYFFHMLFKYIKLQTIDRTEIPMKSNVTQCKGSTINVLKLLNCQFLLMVSKWCLHYDDYWGIFNGYIII